MFFRRDHSSIFLRYLSVPATVALAIWGRLLLDPALGDRVPYPTLLFAVLLASAYGGIGPALLALAAGALSVDYFVLEPRGGFKLEGADQYAGMALFIATSLGIAALGEGMRRARRRAEANAHDAEEQAALFEHIHEAVLAWAWNGPITFWNGGAERLYGFPGAEALGRVSHDLFQTHTEGGIESIVSALERKGRWEGELEQLTRDGRRVIVESRMVLVRNMESDSEPAFVLEANRDITLRKRAEAALWDANRQLEARVGERSVELAEANASLRETNERVRLIVAGVKDYAILMLDPAGHIATWNRGAEHIKGYRAEEIVGRHFSRFYPQEDIDAGKPERELKEALTEGHCLDEGWRLRKDGSRFWANVLITPIHDELGQLRGFSKVTRDMTQTRLDEAAIRETQARMGGIINSAMDAIISIDHQQNIVLFNAAAERMFQCPAAKAIGGPIDQFLPSRFRERHRRHVQDFGATGVTSRSMRSLSALSGVRLDGEEFPIEASISQVEVAGQRIFTVILRDITERERANANLRQSEAQLRTIVEALDEGLVLSDLNGKLQHFNRAALEMHGFVSMEECLRREPEFADSFELRKMDGSVLPLTEWPVSRILRGELLRNMEVHIRRTHLDAEGREWARVFRYGGTIVHDPEGRPLLAVITIGDITEREQAAQAIRQLNAGLEQRVAERTVQLEAANKELEAFSYSVSHDLRAPLRAVDGFAQALMEDYGPDLPEQGRHYVATIRGGAQRMGNLIDDLLMFARLSRQALNKSPVDTAKLVRDTLLELKAATEDHAVEIRLADLPACLGDRALLKQVWTNLLSNALKYSRRRAPAVIEIGTISQDGETAYFVRDNGTGFDMKYAHKLFGVFQRLHRAEDFEGTGVGLAIVQRVVHRHGGRIWAEAAVDRGATFYFTLAALPEEENPNT